MTRVEFDEKGSEPADHTTEPNDLTTNRNTQQDKQKKHSNTSFQKRVPSRRKPGAIYKPRGSWGRRLACTLSTTKTTVQTTTAATTAAIAKTDARVQLFFELFECC